MPTVIVMLLLVALSPSSCRMGYRHLRVKPLDIGEPAQLRADTQQGRRSRRHAKADGLAQREAA